MTAIVDTSVWSLALRRRFPPMLREAVELADLIREGEARIIGPIRQELLSGVRGAAQFQRLRLHLRGFPDTELEIDDFELAAEFFNRCRSRGIQGASTDFLVCAVAARRTWSVFTTDRDFAAFAKVVPVTLYVPGL